MAISIREALNADGMSLALYTGGQTKVGFGIAGTWAGTVSFYGSTDGVNFIPISVTPFASGTTVQSTTATGNWEFAVANYVVVKVTFTRTSGTVNAKLSTSTDASYQEAFLGASTVFVNSEASGTNTLTQAAQTNRAWTLQELHVSMSGPGGQAAKIIVYDGDKTSTVLWADFLETVSGSVGQRYTVNLPSASAGGAPGVTGTVGTAMTILLTGVPTTVTTELNAKFTAG